MILQLLTYNARDAHDPSHLPSSQLQRLQMPKPYGTAI